MVLKVDDDGTVLCVWIIFWHCQYPRLCRMIGWLVNNELESDSCSLSRYYLAFARRDWEKLQKISVMTVCVLAETWTKHLPKSSLGHYHCTNLLWNTGTHLPDYNMLSQPEDHNMNFLHFENLKFYTESHFSMCHIGSGWRTILSCVRDYEQVLDQLLNFLNAYYS
jgi:hypothetical protein